LRTATLLGAIVTIGIPGTHGGRRIEVRIKSRVRVKLDAVQASALCSEWV
jgi:hypothetical protein